MWVAQVMLPYRKGFLLGDHTIEYNTSIYGYPVSHFVKKKILHVITVGTMEGDAKNVAQCISALQKQKRMVSVTSYGNFGITHMLQPLEMLPLYNPLIIHVKPAIVTEKGDYFFEIASWERPLLEKAIKALRGDPFNGKLNWIKNKKITNVQIMGAAPELTEKQKRCLTLAVEKGYYQFPRKITLKELAKLSGIAYSTYQFHLQNAEKKVMPFVLQTYR